MDEKKPNLLSPRTECEQSGFDTKFSLTSFVERVEKLSRNQRVALERTAFGNLLRIPNFNLSRTLLAELMDKWRCDKGAELMDKWRCDKRAFSGAFSLAHEKISMTELDVALILGIPAVGKLVRFQQDEPFSDLEERYGAAPEKRKITVKSIESILDSYGGAVNDDFIRTFLLFTLGTFLFPNSNGTIDTRYLSFLSNLKIVHQYAWGSAVLEDLQMWLSRRKAKSVQYVGGCLLFLQIWFYEHIDMARPSPQNDPFAFPRACRWGYSRPHPRPWVSAEFEKLRCDQIIRKLQPTAIELEADIVKDALLAQKDES